VVFTPSVYSALRAVLPENNGIFDQCLRTISYVSLYIIHINAGYSFGSGLTETLNVASSVERIRLYSYDGMPTSFYSNLTGVLQWLYDKAYEKEEDEIIDESFMNQIIKRVCKIHKGTFTTLITNNKDKFASLKSEKTELEWLDSIENFSTFLMRSFTQNKDSLDYDSLPDYIVNDKYQTEQDSYRYREWLFNVEILNPPLLNLQTKTDSHQVSSTNNLAQLLKNIGVIGVIELPELLSDKRKANDVLQEEKPNNIPPTENTQQEIYNY
jgi:hypothetical protein